MSNMNVDISSIVKNIGNNIKFLQPMYEAIVNSLEAHATNIDIELFDDSQFVVDGHDKKINSFEVVDDGEGFVEENINSFDKLWQNIS